MLNYYADEKLNRHRLAELQRTAANDRLAKLATTPRPRHTGRTRTAVGLAIIRLGTRIAPPAQPLAAQAETG